MGFDICTMPFLCLNVIHQRVAWLNQRDSRILLDVFEECHSNLTDISLCKDHIWVRKQEEVSHSSSFHGEKK